MGFERGTGHTLRPALLVRHASHVCVCVTPASPLKPRRPTKEAGLPAATPAHRGPNKCDPPCVSGTLVAMVAQMSENE